ncbi:MAG: hypothetical protein DMG37_14215 [Acidobacteria bacterium]|nr:MAG: hypothetical protein DMG37_14215 [Acidobacteriota bacterium]
MKPALLALLAIGASSFLSGCAPENSLFPLYTGEESMFNERLVGAWRMQKSPDQKSSDDSYWIFSQGKEKNTYLLRGVDAKKSSGDLTLTAHLLRLGAYTFIDFATPEDSEELNVHISMLPYIPSHVFGRMRIEKTYVRVDLLDDEWVKKQIQAGKLNLAHVEGPSETVLTAPTDELRKFALEHAEDEKAFAFTEYFVKEQ